MLHLFCIQVCSVLPQERTSKEVILPRNNSNVLPFKLISGLILYRAKTISHVGINKVLLNRYSSGFNWLACSRHVSRLLADRFYRCLLDHKHWVIELILLSTLVALRLWRTQMQKQRIELELLF